MREQLKNSEKQKQTHQKMTNIESVPEASEWVTVQREAETIEEFRHKYSLEGTLIMCWSFK